MALKPTIYKANVALSDMDRDHYDQLQLTLAQHPSETLERMMVRLVVFCLNAGPELSFTRGLSSTEEPDLWQRSLDDQVLHWLEVGQPEPERIKKATNQARQVSVYAFGKSADVWWSQNGPAIQALPRTRVYQFVWEEIQRLAQLAERTMDLVVTITEQRLYINRGEESVELALSPLQVM